MVFVENIPNASKDRRGTGRFFISMSMPNFFNFSALSYNTKLFGKFGLWLYSFHMRKSDNVSIAINEI